MAQAEELGETEEDEHPEKSRFCHPGYLASLPGFLRILNIMLCCVVIGLWTPGYEHDYKNPNQIVNFRDYSKNYGAGYKSETLNQFALADVILCLMFSLALLVAMVVVSHSYVDWNRMNKVAHFVLALFHGIGTVCASVGLWYFEENCCRVDLEWNGIGFSYKPAVHEFGYQKNNGHCNCWLTKRDSDTDTDRMYSTAIWEPQHYPEKYSGEESTFVSFAAHHVHIHEAALLLMVLNTIVYLLASVFSKPQTSPKSN